ncbi:hypothetical protein JYK22_21375, partial [Nonomuraea sp. RK-328]|nr:hypothetical protein [Nonomuraea sp. RK-328]
MAGASNTFEGGTNAVTITTANSGGLSGAAFSAVSNVTYTTERAAHGSLAGRIAPLETGTVEHALSGSGIRYARVYAYWTAFFQPLELRLTNSGNWYLVDITDTTVSLSATVNGSPNTLAQQTTSLINQWVRIELQGTSAAGGQAEARFYAADSQTALFTLSGSAARTADTWSAVAYGGQNLAESAAYIDDVGWSDVDWLGSAVPARVPVPVPVTPQAIQRASRW